MIDYEQLLQEDVAGYSGPHAELIQHVPALYGLLTRMLVDASLPPRLRPLVISSIAYFNLQGDVLPEDLEGPRGYVDDLFYCAFVIDQICRELESEKILIENWSGEVPIVPLVHHILSQEKELIGEKRALVLWFIGYDYLPKS
jgi:uncharacterized membrane protein YkvA (DUF1232 family)